LFGLSPQRRQFAYEKTPNKLGTPTEEAFFNRILPTELVRSATFGERGTGTLWDPSLLLLFLDKFTNRLYHIDATKAMNLNEF